jgi:hypothetical protein
MCKLPECNIKVCNNREGWRANVCKFHQNNISILTQRYHYYQNLYKYYVVYKNYYYALFCLDMTIKLRTYTLDLVNENSKSNMLHQRFINLLKMEKGNFLAYLKYVKPETWKEKPYRIVTVFE